MSLSTIAAIYTPPAAGGLAIIRIRSADNRKIAGRVVTHALRQMIKHSVHKPTTSTT